MKVSRSLNLVLMDQALVSGVNFLTGILLVHFLGIEGFGTFTLLSMVILLVAGFQSSAIIAPMMSIGGKLDAAEEQKYDAAVFIQQLLFSLISAPLLGAGVLISTHVHPEWQISAYIPWLMLVTAANQLQEFFRRYFFNRSRPGLALVNDSISYGGQILILLLLAALKMSNVANTLWIMAVTSLLAVLVGWVQSPSFHLSRFHLDWRHIQSVFNRHRHVANWLLASTLMNWLSGNYLLLASAAILDTTALGVLKACQNMIAVTHVLFMALSNIIPVRTARLLHQEGLPAMERYWNKALWAGGGATVLLALPALFFPSFTLRLIYGPAMAAYGGILFCYAWVYLFIFMVQMLTFALRTLERPRPIFLGYLLTGCMSLASAGPLCRGWGLNGVIVGMLALNIVNCSVLWVGYLKGRRVYREMAA